MTTIVAVRKGDTAAIATDTLTTYQDVKESASHVVGQRKSQKFGDCVVAVAGLMTARNALAHYFEERAAEGDPPPDFSSTAAIYNEWLAIHDALASRHFSTSANRGDDLALSPFEALIAAPSGIFAVDCDRTVQEFAHYAAYGSGRDFALGALYSTYDRDEWGAEEIARHAVEAAAEFDLPTGLPAIVETVRLTESNGMSDS